MATGQASWSERYELAAQRGRRGCRRVRRLRQEAHRAGLVHWERLFELHLLAYEHPEQVGPLLEAFLQDGDLPGEARVAGWLLRRGLCAWSSDTEGVIRCLTAVIEGHAVTPQQRIACLVYRAKARFGAREWQATLEDLDTILASPHASEEQVADALSNRGAVLGELERYEEAVRDLAAAVERSPRHSQTACRARMNLSTVHIRCGEWAKALQEATEALRGRGLPAAAKASALFNRGIAFMELNRHRSAVKDFTAVLRRRSAARALRDRLARLGRARAYAKLGRLRRALADAKAVVEDPQVEASVRYEALCVRGNLHGRRREYAAAVQDLTAAIEEPFCPDHRPVLRFQRADALEELGRIEEALSDYSAFLEARPDPTIQNAHAHLARAFMYLMLEDRDHYQADLKAVIEHPAASDLHREIAARVLAGRTNSLDAASA